MNYTEIEKELAFRIAITGQIFINHAEEFVRRGFLMQNEKRHVNNAIKKLRLKERLFEQLVDSVPEEFIEVLLSEFEEYINTASALDFSKLKEATQILKKL